MDKRRFFSLFLLVLVLFSFISGCAGVGRIDDFFSNDEYLQHGKIIDFALFFIMFFALSYLGLTKVWGEGYGKGGSGKGAIVALSISLSLALAFALVTQTRFSITTIFPMAKAVFFLIMTFLLAGLIIHSKVFGETKMAKAIAFIISLIAMYLIFSIGTHMICQMSDNMDDPACKSDFFNWFFTIMDRWFGFSDWGSGDGSEGGTGTAGAGAGGTAGTTPGATGPIQGGCRLDITFQYDSTNVISGLSQLPAYVATAEKMGITRLYVYGFASGEGGRLHNSVLATNRAKVIAQEIVKINQKIKVTPYGKGQTNIFSATLDDNRRAVIVTNNTFSSLAPSPAAGTLSNCLGTESNQPSGIPGAGSCGDNKKGGSEQCDGTDSQACPGNCIAAGQPNNCTCKPDTAVSPTTGDLCGNKLADPGEVCDPTIATSCGADRHCSADCKQCISGPPPTTESNIPWWMWVLLAILLLLALRAFRRKMKSFNPKQALAMKDLFLREIEKIKAEKNIIWHHLILATAATPTTADVKESKAEALINDIEKELKDKNWKTIKDLALENGYLADPGRLLPDAERFGIDEQHTKMLKRAFEDMQVKYPPRRFPLKQWDSVMFYSRLKDSVKEFFNDNEVTKELHHFFRLQLNLKRLLKKFRDDEEKIQVGFTEKSGTSWFWRKPKKEVESGLKEATVPSPTTYGLIKVTQAVRDLCNELDAKIAEIMAEEPRAKHTAMSQLDLRAKFDEENQLIDRLRTAIIRQKHEMLLWNPVIDNVNVGSGEMRGHIQTTTPPVAPTPNDFIYQWWLFNDHTQFLQAANHHVSPHTLVTGSHGIKLDGPAAGFGQSTAPNAPFTSNDPAINSPANAGKIVALGAVRVADIVTGNPASATGHWHWAGHSLGGQSTVRITIIGSGTSNPGPGTHTFPLGSNLALTATANPGAVVYQIRRKSTTGGGSPVTHAPITPAGPAFNILAHTCTHLTDLEEIEIEFRQGSKVRILVTGRGTSDPAPGIHYYPLHHDLRVESRPVAGDVLLFMRRSSTPAGGATAMTLVTPPSGVENFTDLEEDEEIELSHGANQSSVIIRITGSGATNPAAGTYTRPLHSSLPITATPAPGYVFQEIKRTSTPTGAAPIGTSESILPYVATDLQNNEVIDVIFTTGTSPQSNVSIKIIGSGISTPAVGKYALPLGSDLPITATPASGYVFQEVRRTSTPAGAAPIDTSSYALPYVAKNLQHTEEIEIIFRARSTGPFCNLVISVIGGGSSNPSPGTYTNVYGLGEDLPVSAIIPPGSGVNFVQMCRWSVDVVTGSNPPELIKNPNHTFSDLRHFEHIVLIFKGGSTPPPDKATVIVRVSGDGHTQPPVGIYTLKLTDSFPIKIFPHAGSEFRSMVRLFIDKSGKVKTEWIQTKGLAEHEFKDLSQFQIITVFFDKIPTTPVGPVNIRPNTNAKPHPPEFGVQKPRPIGRGLKMTPSRKGVGAKETGADVPDLVHKLEKESRRPAKLEIGIYRKRQLAGTEYDAVVPDPKKDVPVNDDEFKKLELRVGIDTKNVLSVKKAGEQIDLTPYNDSLLSFFVRANSKIVNIGEIYYLYFVIKDDAGKELDHNWIEIKIVPKVRP